MDEDYEWEFYLDFMEQKLNLSDEKKKFQHFACQKIIELMNILDEKKNIEFVKNALIIVIALFEDKEPDLLVSRTIDINDLPNQQKESIYDLLKLELTN